MSSFPIDPRMSLNRVQLVDLPGIQVDADVTGKTGYQLISSKALTVLIRDHIIELHLDPSLTDYALRLAFERCFESSAETVRTVAESVAVRLGRNLGYLLLTLHRGDSVNREVRAEWTFDHWDYWGQIRQVWLGGGVVSGALKRFIPKAAEAVLAENGAMDYQVRVSPYALDLATVGAARYARADVGQSVVLDFGQTLVKRAAAIYEDGCLLRLDRLPPRPIDLERFKVWVDDPVALAEVVMDVMVTAIIEACETISGKVSTAQVSIAAYVKDGHPLDAQRGVYKQLIHITDNAQKTLSEQVSARLGYPLDITLLHDGSAAAATYAGQVQTAVITIGTALGIGFPPESDDLRPLAADFSLAGSTKS